MDMQERAEHAVRVCIAAIYQIYDDVKQFFIRLHDAFGWNFVVSVIIIYGVNQGLGEGWLMQLHKYYLKDILQVTASEAQSMTAVAHTAWNIKVISRETYIIISHVLSRYMVYFLMDFRYLVFIRRITSQ